MSNSEFSAMDEAHPEKEAKADHLFCLSRWEYLIFERWMNGHPRYPRDLPRPEKTEKRPRGWWCCDCDAIHSEACPLTTPEKAEFNE